MDIADSRQLGVQIGDEVGDRSNGVHNEQVSGDESGEQHRLAGLDPAQSPRRRW
ncbi:hypothetical protein ACNAW0_00930 [Micromonospora sp. SL1-18]|uniref:hypothetical protein n=1 Tax=Micromonospora sp. SL1-18 TaxID=3399128 RepID=UPI003A4E2916